MSSDSFPTIPAGLCFHCLQPIPADTSIEVEVAGKPREVCCHGCQAVAGTIAAHGLTHFYQFRDISNPTSVELVPAELQALEAYDNDELQQRFVQHTDSGTSRQITLSVDGMTCAACAWLIEREVMRCNGVLQVGVNATTERVQIRWTPEQARLSQLLKAIHGIGYKALPFQQDMAEQDFARKRKQYVKRLGVAGLATMQVMMIAVALYFGAVGDLASDMQLFLWWVSLAFATPVILYSAQPFYISALRSIQASRPNMDVPVSIALLGAYSASAYATFTAQGEVYFESVSMFTLFLLAGRYIELLARQRAVSVAANLVKLLPAIAERELDQTTEQVLVQQLQPGDIIRVKPGTTLPVDGELLSSRAQVNESLMTGESRPVTKQQGEAMLAGSVNQSQSVRLKVTATQHDTVLAGIVALQDSALASKPKLALMADKIASVFVWRLLIVAALTFFIWTWIDPSKAFWVTLAVLVATCPCALSLAAPTAVTGAIHRLNKHSVLVRNGDILENLHQIKTIIFDKTGTLTTGNFELQQSHYYSQNQSAVNDLVASIESYSEHPLATPFRNLGKATPIAQIEHIAGQGLVATTSAGNNYRLGSLAFVQQWHAEFLPSNSGSNVFLSDNNQVLAEFEVQDALREDAKSTLQALKAKDYRLVMLTGDSAERAQRVAAELGIDEVYAKRTPADKLTQLKQLQSEQPVMMVGDGINDGPVLAQADVSMSFAAAADLAKASADTISLSGKLDHVALVLGTGIRCRQIMRQNVTWALVYNVSILPVAMAGFVTPYIAAIGMSVSSLLVLGNSLRLYKL
ncbi:MAG: heavy metal translocating P-type ATPase [Idiomarina sp.]